jgi:hypothetical protein
LEKPFKSMKVETFSVPKTVLLVRKLTLSNRCKRNAYAARCGAGMGARGKPRM